MGRNSLNQSEAMPMLKRKRNDSNIEEDFDDDKFFETQMMKEADKMEKIQKMEEKIHFKGGKYKNCTFNFNFS